MKKTKTNTNNSSTVFLLSLFLILVGACTNLDDIENRLDEHDKQLSEYEKRLKAIETLTSNANKTIINLQQLVDAQTKNIAVVSYQALTDGTGYELSMSDGSKITLKNGRDGAKGKDGKDGSTPLIGIKEDGGNLYWTLNGELLRDAKGDSIRANGKDGAGQDGNTPQLRVNTDGFWEVSMDKGNTWQTVKDTNNNPVKAKGSDASVDLTIDESDTAITITYNGKQFIILKSGTTPSDRPKMAIEYVAEYNLAQDGSFTTSHKNDDSGYFTWNEAKAAIPDGYHLPTQKEWRGIVPDYGYVKFKRPVNKDNVNEEITVNGETKVYTADYRCEGNKIAYGLRFKDDGNIMLVAYRYEAVDSFTKGNLYSHLKVTARYLGATFTGTVDDIANETYWNSNTGDDVSRIFPACGWKDESNTLYFRGTNGYCWSATEQSSNYVWHLNFNGSFADVYSNYLKTYGFTVRPFVQK